MSFSLYVSRHILIQKPRYQDPYNLSIHNVYLKVNNVVICIIYRIPDSIEKKIRKDFIYIRKSIGMKVLSLDLLISASWSPLRLPYLSGISV